MKISSCDHKGIWDMLVAHGEALLETRFGRTDGASPELKAIADKICKDGIEAMLQVRVYATDVFEVFTNRAYSLSLPTYTRLAWIGLSRLAIACRRLWSLLPSYLSVMVTPYVNSLRISDIHFDLYVRRLTSICLISLLSHGIGDFLRRPNETSIILYPTESASLWITRRSLKA